MSKKKQVATKTAVAPEVNPQSLQDASVLVAEALAKVLRPQHTPSSEWKVGIRNISDNTIGIRSPVPGESDLDLHGDVPGQETSPGKVAIISYAFWKILRKSPHMERGAIIRDDSILGESFVKAPADDAEDIPESWKDNAIIDPNKWIEEKGSEEELRKALERVKTPASLRRIRRVVDMALSELEKKFHPDPQRAKKALQALPAKLQMIDHYVTMRLERPDEV